MKETDVAIIGGGPAGLYAASLFEESGIDYLLLESSDALGGQVMRLYPNKLVVDVPEFPIGEAKTIIDALLKKIDIKRAILSSEVISIERENKKIIIKTASDSITAKKAIIATGLGKSVPRPLGVKGEKECPEILYELKDTDFLKGKSVAVFGGGDSALDWARDLSSIAKQVSLIHRRTEFRGNEKTIEGKPINVYLPYVPDGLIVKSGHLMGVTVKNVSTGELVEIPCDYVLVNYGQIPMASTFSFPISNEGFGLVVNKNHEAAPGIFAAGDVSYMPGKKKRMAPAFEEIREIISLPEFKNAE